jgi:ABC-type cobalamin/Fe3+-siderophores transport system ATPase subunit
MAPPARRILFVLGCPGVGKTTLVRGLLGDAPALDGDWTVLLPERVTTAGALARLSEVHPQWSLAVLDGIRFFTHDVATARQYGEVLGVLLVAPRATISRRRLERGSRPASCLFLDRQTNRARAMAQALGASEIDATMSKAEVLNRVRQTLLG